MRPIEIREQCNDCPYRETVKTREGRLWVRTMALLGALISRDQLIACRHPHRTILAATNGERSESIDAVVSVHIGYREKDPADYGFPTLEEAKDELGTN